jgi:DNA end-binding protein Ku
MKSIWTGTIGFGLVNIPIKLFSAVQESNLDLDMLDKKDHANIKFKRVNEHSGREVPWKQIVRAYNLNGKYVVLDDTDFEEAMPEKTKTVDIHSFVDESDIDPLLYETPYYIEPEKQGVRAYALLNTALSKSNKVGLGSFVLRNKEHLCIIKSYGKLLILQQLRFADEIRDTKKIIQTASAPKPGELKMALSLIKQLSESFDIRKYKDEYRAKLLKRIKAKASGKKTVIQPLKIVHSKSRDLMDQLKESLHTSRKKAS